MLMFLATLLEQLDVALDHVSKRGVHDARFGLMLTDNAVELVLHQIATDKARDLKSSPSYAKNIHIKLLSTRRWGSLLTPK